MTGTAGGAGSPTLTVRRVRSEEYAEVGRMTVAAYQADGLLHVSDGTHDHYSPRLRDVATRNAEAEVWVAVDRANRLRGTLTWCPQGSPWRELAKGADQAEFRMLAVPPWARRQGVAEVLVEAALARARAEGARVILLSSLPTMTAAHSLYRSLGFVRAPALDHRPLPNIQLWCFRLELSPAG